MKRNVAVFFGALFGALGVLLFLVAFGSDYWLLVTEVGKCSGEHNVENVTFHHEGFFWRCWFSGVAEENTVNIWKFWYIYRGFWAVFLFLGVMAAIIATFFIICAAPFASHILFKAAGGAFITAGILFSLVVVLYVIWVQAVADMESYTNMKRKDCLEFTPYIMYGWSFLLAPAGIFFSLLSGLLFLLVGRHIHRYS